MLDDLRNYLQLASGLTEATTAKARDAVAGLLAHGIMLGAKAMPDPQVVGQVQDLAEDLVSTSRANREALTGMIRSEVDKAVARMGFVREDELAALRRHVLRLETELTELREADAAQPATVVPDGGEGVAAGSDDSEHSEPAVDDAGTDGVGGAEAPVKKKKKILVEPEAEAGP